MKRKICVITGTRAEYGLLKWVMQEIQQSRVLDLQLVVTGQHLSTKYGLTYQEIEQDEFDIHYKIDMQLESDCFREITTSMGHGLMGFADAFQTLAPDMVLVLGDRYEILMAAAAAMMFQIPIAHLHGGEATEGVIDEAIRHAVTKMAHLHFVGAEEYRQRVIQLGEQPDRVFLVGGVGVDAMSKTTLLDKQTLEEQLDFQFAQRNLLVTFHPVTLEKNTAYTQMSELLNALDTLVDTHIIFTAPNSDPANAIIFDLIQQFCERHPNARFYSSLGQLRYLSCLQYVDAVVGNSSSGLAEAPTFKIGTVNIGDRQKGRLKATSIIDCAPIQHDILAALLKIYSPEFKERLQHVTNPYGDGGAIKKIVRILESVPLEAILKKVFYNLPGILNHAPCEMSS